MQWDIEQFNFPSTFVPSNDFCHRSTNVYNYNACNSFNSLYIRSLATSIHRDIFQLCDQQLEQDFQSSRRHVSHGSNTNRQMYKILEKISTLNRKIVNLENIVNKEMGGKYFCESQNFNYRSICNSTRSLINITTSLKYDLLNECRPYKPTSYHRPVCNVDGVPDVVDKIMMLENQLFDLLTDIECKLEKEKCKLNLHIDTLPSINYKNQQKYFKTSQKSGVYISCTCPTCVSKKDVTTSAKRIGQYIKKEVPCERKKFQFQKSNINCYSSSFTNNKDICKYPVSFIYIRKKASDQCGCGWCECNRKHRMPTIKCQKIKTCVSVSEASTCTCDSCVNLVRCTSSTRFHTRKILRKGKGKQKLVATQKKLQKSCISVKKSSGLLDVRKSLSVARVHPKIKKYDKRKSRLKIVKSKSPVRFDIRKSTSSKTVREHDKVKTMVTPNLNITKSHSSVIFATQKSRKRVHIKSKNTKPKKIWCHKRVNKSDGSVYKSDSLPIVGTEKARTTRKWYDKCKNRRQKKGSCSILTCCSIFKSDSSISVLCDSNEHPIFRKVRVCKDPCHDYHDPCLPCMPEKSYPCVEEVYIHRHTRSKTRVKTKDKKPPRIDKPHVDFKDSYVQAEPVAKKSETKHTWTDKGECAESSIQVKLDDSAQKRVTDERGMDPIEELLPKKVKTLEKGITTIVEKDKPKVTIGLDAVDLTPKKKTVESAVNVDTIEKPIKKILKTTGSEAYKPDTVTKATHKKPPELKETETNTEIIKLLSQHTSPIPEDKPVMIDKVTSQEKVILKHVATVTDVKKTMEQKVSTVPPEVAHKDILVRTLEDPIMPEVLHTGTNTDLLGVSHVKIGTSITEVKEKATVADIKQKTEDKVTNTSKRVVIEKEVNVSIKEKTFDKVTNTEKRDYVEKQISASMKKETVDRKTSTSAYKKVEKYVNTDEIQPIEKETFEKETETDRIEEIKVEGKQDTADVEFKHCITQYIYKPCDQSKICDKTCLQTRSSIRKLPSGEYQEKFNAQFETDHLQHMDSECRIPAVCSPETCCYCQYNLEKEYQQILEKKCKELLKKKGYRLIKERKSKRQTRPSYNSSVYNKNKRNKKLSRQKNYSSFKSISDLSCKVISMETIRIIKKPSSNIKNYNKNKNNSDTSVSSEGQKLVKDEVNEQNIEDNQITKNNSVNNNKNVLGDNTVGKKLMHLTYSSKSSIQILLPSGAELYEEEENKSAAKAKRKINIRKKAYHSPENSREQRVSDKNRFNTKWKEIVNQMSNNFKNSKITYSELYSDSSESSLHEECVYSSEDYSSDSATSSFDSDHKR